MESLLTGIVQEPKKTFRQLVRTGLCEAWLCGEAVSGLLVWGGHSCPLVSLTLPKRFGLMTKDAKYWIEKLSLEAHPEGGFYHQTYKADLVLTREALPPQFSFPRAASTAIYFLLEAENFSAFHRLRSDEVWHFYQGAPLLVHVIGDSGEYSKILLGSDPDAGEALQAVVKAGSWFASHVKDGTSFALVGCTVAPGFDFEDFELAKREDLTRLYPQHRKVIEKLTRQ